MIRPSCAGSNQTMVSVVSIAAYVAWSRSRFEYRSRILVEEFTKSITRRVVPSWMMYQINYRVLAVIDPNFE